MLAISVGGMPITETMVSTLKMSFCSMPIRPRLASSRNCTLSDSRPSCAFSDCTSRSMRSSLALVSGVRRGGKLGFQKGQGARQGQQRLLDQRVEFALLADLGDDALEQAAAHRLGPGAAGAGEDLARALVEAGGQQLQFVREVIDDAFSSAMVAPMAVVCGAVDAERLQMLGFAGLQPLVAHRQQRLAA